MILSAKELIRKKALGKTLDSDELRAFFEGFSKGEVTDDQASAMVTAIFCRGMEMDEVSTLTQIMRESGHNFHWPATDRPVIDKHSTGGVGDKTSLVILPLCIINGLRVPMICGRGLGHTGGTIDKLLAIPGMRVDLDPKEVETQIAEVGGAFIEQTSRIAPLDGKLYALRDSTGMVASVPLIVSSILSKKLSEGLDGLLLDVKTGQGSFMVREEESLTLAKTLQTVGESCGLKVSCVISSMDSPLGHCAGNSLEVMECIEIMQGRGPVDTQELVIELTTQMIRLAFPDKNPSDIRSKLISDLATGRALEAFSRVVAAQGGDTRFIDHPERLNQSSIQKPLEAETSGYLQQIDVRLLGHAIIELGGGRRRRGDQIDSQVGFSGLQRTGTWVEAGEPIGMIHANSEESCSIAMKLAREALHIGSGHTSDRLIRSII